MRYSIKVCTVKVTCDFIFKYILYIFDDDDTETTSPSIF